MSTRSDTPNNFPDYLSDSLGLTPRVRHLKPAPTVVERQREWTPQISKYSVKDTRVFQDAVQPRIWEFLGIRHPTNRAKKTANELKFRLSHRTVEGWQYRLPNSARLLQMIFAWPGFLEFISEPLRVSEDELRELEAREQRLTHELGELRSELNRMRNSKSWKSDEVSGGS